MKTLGIKRIVSLVLACSLFVGITVFAQEDIGSWLGSILDDVNFGYDTTKDIRINSISEDRIVIESDVVLGELEENIEVYTVVYSEHSILDLLDNSSMLDELQEKEVDIGSNDGKDTFTVELDADDDNLDRNTVYYVSFIPKDDFGIPGDLSPELCFILSTQKYGEGSDCDTLGDGSNSSSDEGHGAAGPDMNLAHITHVKNGDDVTLRWTALEGADEIDLFYRDASEERFEKLDTVNMTDETYKFTLTRGGEHNVKFIPLDNGDPHGIEKIYTFTEKCCGDLTPTPGPTPTPGITKVPTVGPKENIAIIIFVSVLGYFVYRRMVRKAK